MSKTNNLTDFLTNEANAIRTKKGYPSTQKIDPQSFASEIESITTTPMLQSKTVTPSANNQIVIPSSGFDGLSQVTVNGDVDLVPGNIKAGVSIFGVTGNYAGGAANTVPRVISDSFVEMYDSVTIPIPSDVNAISVVIIPDEDDTEYSVSIGTSSTNTITIAPITYSDYYCFQGARYEYSDGSFNSASMYFYFGSSSKYGNSLYVKVNSGGVSGTSAVRVRVTSI